jgi:hypothetical protein
MPGGSRGRDANEDLVKVRQDRLEHATPFLGFLSPDFSVIPFDEPWFGFAKRILLR